MSLLTELGRRKLRSASALGPSACHPCYPENVRLLNTYSDHRVLERPRHDRLFNDIATLIDTGYHGHITKGYLALLYVAHRK